MNLLNNARDAVAENRYPEIHISLKRYEATAAFRKAHPHLEHDQFALLTVHDNGHGIPANVLESIFEPFFTTKPGGKGSGLGLSMVYGAMQTHAGVIDINSSVGNGTSFHLYFPLIDEHIEEPLSGEIMAEQPGSGEVILLVDDEPEVCEAGREVLESLGYNVLVGNNGKEGLDLFTSHQHQVSLVLTDVVMPKMNGIEMAKEIRAMHADMPFIFITGYDKEIFVSEVVQQNDVILSKPLSIPELSRSIQRLLKAV